MRSPLQTVVAASAAICSVALIKGCAVSVRAEPPPSRFFRRLQLGQPYIYSSPAPVYPASPPIPPAPIVLRPVVAPLIQGTLWRVHNGLAAASNSLLGTGIPYAGPLDTGAHVAVAPSSLPPFPAGDAFHGPYRDPRPPLYEGNPTAAGAVSFVPGRDYFKNEEALGHATGNHLYNPYDARAFPSPGPSADYAINERMLHQPQQRLQSPSGGQPQQPGTY